MPTAARPKFFRLENAESVAAVVAIVISIAALVGTGYVALFRLSLVEDRVTKLERIGHLEARMTGLETTLQRYEDRLSDSTFADWWRFRANTEDKVEENGENIDKLYELYRTTPR